MIRQRLDSKKAQAFMEFYLTYGWILLIIVIGIAALSSFGVFTPRQYLPDQCYLLIDLTCLGVYATTSSPSELQIELRNELQYTLNSFILDVQVDGISLKGMSGATIVNCETSFLHLLPGETIVCGYSWTAATPSLFFRPGDKLIAISNTTWITDADSRSRMGKISTTVSP